MTQTPPGPPGQPFAGPPWPGAAQPAAPAEHPDATKALVLGLVAVVGGFMCWLPLAIGPWAWVAGRRAVREIDADPARFSGRPSANAGYVLGVVATVFLALAVLVVVGFVAFFVITALTLEARTSTSF